MQPLPLPKDTFPSNKLELVVLTDRYVKTNEQAWHHYV